MPTLSRGAEPQAISEIHSGVARVPRPPHRGAHLDDLLADAIDGAPVGVQGSRVEVPLRARHLAVELLEEIPGPDPGARVARQPAEHDLGLRIHARDRAVGELEQGAVLLRVRIRDPVLLQVGLVPDLPRLDRQRRRAGSEVLVVAAAPVRAAGAVALCDRLQERLPGEPVLGPIDRGVRRVAGHPLRISPNRRDHPDPARGQLADEVVLRAPPEVGAVLRLHRLPLEQIAERVNPGRSHRLHVPAVERRALALLDAEELGSDRGSRRGRAEQRDGERDQQDRRPGQPPGLRASPHPTGAASPRRSIALHPTPRSCLVHPGWKLTSGRRPAC